MVSITTRVAPSCGISRRVASIPSSTGIRMSISTTSGLVSSAAATACSPSAASPATSISGSACRMSRKPPRMLERIGQRLLDDAEGGQVKRRRQGPRRALDPQRDRQPRLPDPADQLLQVGQARLRLEGGRAVVGPEHTEQRAHLIDRLPAGGGDHLQRIPHVRLLPVQDPCCAPGLDHHHRYVVRHHVVQLARDPAPLDRHRGLRLQLPLLGQLAIGPLQRHVLVPPATDGPPGRPRRHQPDERRDDVPGVLAVQPGGDEGRRRGRHKHRRHPQRPPSLGAAAHRVGGQRQRDERLERGLVRGRGVDARGIRAEHDSEGGQRPPRPPGDRRGRRQCKRHPQRLGPTPGGIADDQDGKH